MLELYDTPLWTLSTSKGTDKLARPCMGLSTAVDGRADEAGAEWTFDREGTDELEQCNSLGSRLHWQRERGHTKQQHSRETNGV